MPSPPDILWIVTTQWRGQAGGWAGDPNARTPNLDRLAARGVWFRQAVTPHPFGPFARAALLTGVASPANGVRDYFDPLPAGSRTIAHRLGEHGYRTAWFGKWHLARRDPAAPLVGEAHARMVVPPDHRGGFAHWEGFEGGFLLNDPWLHGSGLPEPVRFSGYQGDVLCRRAVEWWSRPADQAEGAGPRPRFAVVSLEAPHPPYDAPVPEGILRPDPAVLVLPGNVPCGGEIEARVRRELAGYHAHIAATDRAIGRLLDAIPSGVLVVFTSVHGDMHGAHGRFRKGWPHEESVRVPLLMSGPGCGGQRTEGGIDDRAVSLLDLSEMMLATVENRSPNSGNAGSRISMPSVVNLPEQCDRVWRGVRTVTRKLVLNADGSPWLFFDLAADPLERVNLAGDPARRDEIAALAALTR
jgi:arylsulfatase A-like enzyme